MAETQVPLALRTGHGPVGLRQKRNQVTLMVEGSQRDITITKEWLRGQREEGMYQKAVKQAMLIAALRIKVDDGSDPAQKKYTPQDIDEAKQKIDLLTKGREKILVSSTKKKSLQQVAKTRERERDMLIKFSKKACLTGSMAKRERAFIIDNGELLVYKGKGQNDKLTAHYKLKDAQIHYESIEANQLPKWEDGYTSRIRVDCAERLAIQKKPLFLYASDPSKLQRWKRAFQLAKVLVAENDRRSLKTAIGRATSGALQKAWEGLSKYYHEIASTRSLVKNMAMRLVKVDISRGWTKFRLTYQKKMDTEKLRKEKEVWAARFISEKLARMGNTKAKPAEDVREHVITRIQKSFRRYREDMIFDRLYPLGSAHMSRVQEAKLGKAVDFSMYTRSLNDVVNVILRGDALAKWNAQKDFFATKKPTYSDDLNLPIGTAVFYVSDNLSSLSFGKQIEDENAETVQALSKADWSKFVNLDRISSVVLFTEPKRGAKLSAKDSDAGVWCTINGPRIAWDRQTKMIQQEKPRKKILAAVGDSSGLKVPQMLSASRADELTWVAFKLELGKSTVKPEKREEDAPQPKFYAVVHILGYTYSSSYREGPDADFGFTCEAKVPVASPDEFVALDDTEVGIEIFQDLPDADQDGKPERTLLLVGSEKLAKLFNPKKSKGNEPAKEGEEGATNAENKKVPDVSIREWIKDGHRSEDFDIKLSAPYDLNAKSKDAEVKVNIDLKVQGPGSKGAQTGKDKDKDKSKPEVIVSPELVGAGVQTNLFTSHRGLWFDQYQSNGQFNINHVPNFIELSLGTLRFPSDEKGKDKDEEDDEKYPLYRVKVTLNGFSLYSPALHRPKKSWSTIIDHFADPNVIKFSGSKMFLPIPPGCWSNEDIETLEFATQAELDKWKDNAALKVKAKVSSGLTLAKVEISDTTGRAGKVQFQVTESGVRFSDPPMPAGKPWEFPAKINLAFQERRIDIQVLRAERQNFPPTDFSQFMGVTGKSDKAQDRDKDKEKNKVKEVPKFYSAITFDNHMLIDQKRPVSTFLFKEVDKVIPVDAYTNYVNMQGGEGVINMEFALRDREFVKGATGQAENRHALCVGDKAMLVVEEPILYPESDTEFSKRFCPGQFEAKKAQAKSWADGHTDRGAPLREPALSSEYQQSGLGTLIPKMLFKQSFLPSFCTDIIPHKFVLPLSEKQFMDEHLPGYYHKIMDDLVKSHDPKAPRSNRAGGMQKPVVTHLSHLSRQVPVTLLATYTDGTCDVEIANDFMDEWHDHPTRKLCIPGSALKVKQFLVDKTKFKGKESPDGLQYYTSMVKDLKDRNAQDAGNYAPWGATVFGVEQGADWVRVGERYLPIKLDGAVCLTPPPDPLVGVPPKVFFVAAADLTEDGSSGNFIAEVKVSGDKAGSKKHSTKPQRQSAPSWKFDGADDGFELTGWSPGDSLEFKIFNQSGNREEIGTCVWPAAKFQSQGFDGDLILTTTEARGKQPKLKVKITAFIKPPQAPRAILQRVHTAVLSAVHYTGINIYDSRFKTTEDVLGAAAPNNDFNPREDSRAELDKNFTIACGPLPPDASGSACQYEWSIGVRSPNETEMYKFAAMLRRCVRMEHYQQAVKMSEYQSKMAAENFVPTNVVRQGPTTGGQLEVLLVEARRLFPKQSTVNKLANADMSVMSVHHLTAPQHAIRHSGPLDDTYAPNLKGTACAGDISRSTPQGSKISAYVNFRMIHQYDIIPYKGQKVQMSPPISDTDSPSWANDPNCERSGGWVFRTGHIDPEKYPYLIIDFEVMQATLPFPTRIGVIQVPVTQRMFLSNPDEPFKNLWLPLVSMDKEKANANSDPNGPKETKLVPNPTGEIHIMARWIPADKMQRQSDGTQKQQMTVKSRFLQDLWPKVCAQRLKEPVYNVECQCIHYNPNLARAAIVDKKEPKMPEAPKDNFKRHAIELANAIHYVECLERRQLDAWDDFEDALNESEMAGVRIGEARLLWLQQQNTEMLEKLSELIQRGIPSMRREKLWAELTLSSRVMEKEGIGGRDEGAEVDTQLQKAEEEYMALLERGLPQNSDAMKQMQEDAFNVASWESTTPPLPEALDLHLRRLKRAQRVCTALIALDKDSGVVYSESLLVLAFFLLLPQGCREVKNQEDESLTFPSEHSVFWLLYTLIVPRINGIYREYYGHPVSGADMEGGMAPATLCAGSGAMQDVSLLECCLAYHENALWQKLMALGFQFSTVFYGAFMRLYATYMPTASVFRFWDILFALSTDVTAEPYARSYLIDLAFGLLKAKKSELMKCMSALEVRQSILGYLGSMYDSCTVIDITIIAHQFLWGSKAGFSSGKIGSLWTQRDDMFKMMQNVSMEQNRILKELCHKTQLKFQGSSKKTADTDPSAGVTTKDLLKNVLPALQQSLDSGSTGKEGTGPKKEFWAMHRPAPLATSVLYRNSYDQVKNFFMINTLPLHHHKQQFPTQVRPLETIMNGKAAPGLEPVDISANDVYQVMNSALQAWAPRAMELFNAFTNRHEALGQPVNYDPTVNQTGLQQVVGFLTGQKAELDRQRLIQMQWNQTEASRHADVAISLNELFISLICASRGTVGEKASALFNIYSYHDPRQGTNVTTNHWKPVSRLAKSITNSAEASGEASSRSLAPPANQEEGKQNVLKLTVESHYFKDTSVIGEVYIPLLSPFIGVTQEDIMDPQTQMYNIWGPNPKPRARANNAQKGASSGSNARPDDEDKVCIGEMCLGITWTPKSIRRPEEGQLTLKLQHLNFFRVYISEVNKLNPWVTVHQCKEREDGEREWISIKRWDPRGLVGTDMHASYLNTHGAFGGHIQFDKTMRDGAKNLLLGTQDSLSHHIRDGHNMGFDPETRNWKWNEVWGLQRSDENMEVLPEFVHVSQRKNVMDCHGVRIITQGILNRAMLNVTNRESVLIAESIFNRQGAVPGFLECILTASTPDVAKMTTVEEVKEKYDYVDCTFEFVLEHERQCKENGGYFNLFTPEWWAEYSASIPYNITKDMSIQEKSGMKKKEKWIFIRFVRGGDGERCNTKIKVSPDGNFEQPTEAQMKQREGEVQLELQNSWPHTKVTKDEFVSCLLGSPLLGESLRRLGNCDHVPHAKRSIPLEVTIMDPHHYEEDKQFLDMIDMQQSVLFEVWDSDNFGYRDFLGEAWLPPLATLTSRSKDIVLPLKKADFSEDSDNGPSREDPQKEIQGDETKNINLKVTGELYVSVAWKFPVYDETKQAASLDMDFTAWLFDLEPEGSLTKYLTDIEKHFPEGLRQVVDAVNIDGGVANIAKFCEPCKIKDKKHKQIFDQFFKRYSEDVMDRAKAEEKKHTGLFEVSVNRARNLRMADAKKRGKVDPMVKVWVRNDVNGNWRKRPFFQTSVVKNNQNPEFNFKGSRDLLTGSYEDRLGPPEEGYAAAARKWIRSAKAQRHIDEDRASKAVSRFRFGADGLQVFFTDNESRQSNQRQGNEGGNHSIEVYSGDSIHEFKMKLTQACNKECEFWRSQAGDGSPQVQKFSDIEIGANHLVMVFVASPKIQRLFAQGKTDTPEYKRAYAQAKADPSSWQPLDPSRSFMQYPQHGFGRKTLQQLRVVEATETYKTQNLRYKKFDEELAQRSYMDVDEADKCFGWAKYVHKEDRDSAEWRPAFISKNKDTGAGVGTSAYDAKWVFQPFQKVKDTEKEKPPPIVIEKTDNVLVAPRCPKFEDQIDPEHVELLEMAKLLRATGKSDWEIETVLNKLLDDKYAEKERLDGVKTEESAKKRITVDNIRAYFQRKEEAEGKAKGESEHKKGAGNLKG